MSAASACSNGGDKPRKARRFYDDKPGFRSGKLVVLRRAESKSHHVRVICQCDCGKTCEKLLFMLRSGASWHCGCMLNISQTKHGMFGTKIYRIWAGVRNRCNPNGGHPRYSGRGIKCCERWASFEAFYEDMGDCPEGMSLDRIDNDGDYSPENCRWATMEQQGRNKRSNRILEIDGRRITAAEASIEYGIKYTTLMRRISVGMSPEEAVKTPVRQWIRSKNREHS